jgi:FkbM family methyltransferase
MSASVTGGNYAWAFSEIPTESVHHVLELGARDCKDSVALAIHFHCPVVAFECNPECIEECKRTLLAARDLPVTLVECAVHEVEGVIEFNAFDTTKYDNVGASSLFEIDFVTHRTPKDPDYGKCDVQIPVRVQAIRLDSYIRKTGIRPDLLCMDIQEAELLALRGLGDEIQKVRYIVLEASIRNTYKGGCTFQEIDSYLEKNGFHYVKSNRYGSTKPPLTTTDFVFFDCLYTKVGGAANE